MSNVEDEDTQCFKNPHQLPVRSQFYFNVQKLSNEEQNESFSLSEVTRRNVQILKEETGNHNKSDRGFQSERFLHVQLTGAS